MFRKIRDPRLVFTFVKRLKTPKHYLNIYSRWEHRLRRLEIKSHLHEACK